MFQSHLINSLILSDVSFWKCHGVYIITNIITNKIYIGSTCKNPNIKQPQYFRKRWLFHVRALFRQKHSNPRLQNSFNKYGIEAFRFNILEVIPFDKDIIYILKREQHYLDLYTPYLQGIGYNVSKVAQNPGYGQKITESKKEKLRKAFLGKPRPDWLKDELGTNVEKYDLEGNFICTYKSISQAAIDTNIQRQDIGQCCLSETKRAGNFQWKYENSDKIIKPYPIKVVEKYSITGELLKVYTNVNEASNDCNLHRGTIYRAISKKQPINNLIFKYKKIQ